MTSHSVAQDPAPSDLEFDWLNNYQQDPLEELLRTGKAKLEKRDYIAAEKSFFEALQIVKVNSGVASSQQAPVLELLIRAQLPQRNWSLINQYLSYFEWLNSKSYQADLGLYLSGVDALANLYMSAAADPQNPQVAHYLVTSRNLTWNAISAIESQLGRDSPELTPWLYKVVLSHFYQSHLAKRRGMTSYDYKTDDPVIINGWSLSKNEYLRKSHSIGLELLNRISEIEAKHRGVESAAIAGIYQGDWETLFKNPAGALEYYRQSFASLLAAGVELNEINRLFDGATVLPESTYYSSLAELQHQQIPSSTAVFRAWSTNFPAVAAPNSEGRWLQQRSYSHVMISLDQQLKLIDEGLKFSDIQPEQFSDSNVGLVDEKALTDQERALAQKYIAILHLRPRLKDGELVPSTGIKVDYFLPRQILPAALSEKNPATRCSSC